MNGARTVSRVLGTSVAVACMLAPAAAHGELPGEVRLGGTCIPAGTSVDEILHILRAELYPSSVELLRPDNAEPHAVVLAMDGCIEDPPSARLTVWLHGERRERQVLIADAAQSMKSRTVALALAEALRDSAAEVTSQPERPTAPAAAPVLRAAPQEPNPPTAPPMEARRPARGVRAGLGFRYVPATSTPVLAAGGALSFDRLGVGLTALVAHRSVDLGDVTLFAIAATGSLDVFDIAAATFLRLNVELGAAFGFGSPEATALSHTKAAVHAGLLAGIVQIVPVATRELEIFAGGGYASSLDADADGNRVAGLTGGMVALDVAFRF